jgi:hypothetical protein
MTEIVAEIGRLIGDTKDVTVPYTTVIWYAQCAVKKDRPAD